jgi:hypothetical protein
MTENIPTVCASCSLMEQKLERTGIKPLDVKIVGRECSALNKHITNPQTRLEDCPFNN